MLWKHRVVPNPGSRWWGEHFKVGLERQVRIRKRKGKMVFQVETLTSAGASSSVLFSDGGLGPLSRS